MAGVATEPRYLAPSSWRREEHGVSPALRPRATYADWALPIAIAVLALLLRLHDIGHEPLWLDEGYTLLFSGLPFDRLITVGGAHEHPPLYYSLVHIVQWIHDSYLAPRVLSACCGTLAVLAVFALGQELYGRVAGSIAAALLAINPFHVWYGQDGRGYELAGLAVVLSYLLLIRALTQPTRRKWALYAACTTLCLYSEYTTVFALLPQVIALLEARDRRSTRPLLLSWAAVALLFLPWIGVVAIDAAGIATDYWIPSPTGGAVANTWLEFVGFLTPCPSPPCSGTEVGIPLLAGHEEFVAVLIVLTVASALAWAIVRRDRLQSMVVLWLLLPFLLVLVLAVRRSLYLDRIFLDATYPLFLLVGGAVTRGRRRFSSGSIAACGLAVLVAGASLANLRPIYAGGVNPDWKSLGHDLGTAYRPGAAVIFNPGVLRTLVASYLPAGWHATYERPLWSRTYLDVPDWQDRYPTSITADKAERGREEARLRDIQFSEAARGRKQVWLVTYDYPGMNDSRRWFVDHGFQNVLSQLYDGDTRLELWDRRPPAALGPAVVRDGGFDDWHRTGEVRIAPWGAIVDGTTTLRRSFAVQPGRAYSVSVEYLGLPPASKPLVTVQVYDRNHRLLALFPRTQWYDWPVNGVWLAQPFGFIPPPGARTATITLSTAWGEAFWRHLSVYRES